MNASPLSQLRRLFASLSVGRLAASTFSVQARTLLRRSLTILLTSLALWAAPNTTFAALATGDIAIIGFNSDTAVDEMTIVALAPIAGGEVIYISDFFWDATNNVFGNATNTTEGIITWTPTSAIAAGTVIKFTINFGTPTATVTGLPGTVSTLGWSGGVTVSGGDNWLIYQGTGASAPSNWIFGWANWSTPQSPTLAWLSSNSPISGTSSMLPSGLTNGTNAIALTGAVIVTPTLQNPHYDNMVYTATKTGTKASLLTAICTTSNWIGDEVTPYDIAAGGTRFSGTNPIFNLGAPSTTVSSLNRVNPATTNLSTVNWTLTFASAVTGVSASNFSLSGAAATGASVGSPSTANGGLTWNVPVTTGSTDGTLTLSLANATGLTPGVSTTLPFTTAGQSYTMDKTAPTISIGAPSQSSIVAGAGSVTYTVTYADTNFSASTLANGNITLNSTGTANGSVNVSGSGLTRTVTISSITGAGTLGISIAASTANDTAGNIAPAAGPSTTFAVTAPAPVVTNVTSSTANGAYNVPDPVSIQVAFDASVTVTGTPTLALNSGGSATYSSGSPGNTLTFNYTVGAGQTAADLDYSATNSLALAGGTINATTGGTAATLTLPAPAAAGSLGANKAIIIDTTAPTIGIGSPSVSSINAGAGSVTYTVTYADTNFNASTLANGNITLNSTGTANATVGVSGSGTTRTVTLSSITGSGTLGITIASGTASDTAGNTAPAAGPSTTFTVLSAPGAPTIGTATAGNATASVAFTAPASNGGSAITGYTVTSSPAGITATGSTSPINVTGLSNGTAYTFTVTATNVVGTGAASAASNSVTPLAPAEIPMTLTSGSLTIDASGSSGAANTVLRFVTGPGGPFLELFDAGRTLGAPAGGTQVNSNTVRIPIASLTGGITLTGSALADTFTLNFTDGDICPPGGIAVHGGAPTISPGDTLVIDGDFTSGGSYGTGSPGGGTLGLDSGNTVTFTGLEPVDMSAASFVDFTITVDPTSVYSGNVITTIAAVDAGVNTEVTFADATGIPNGLESAKLGVVTGTLTILGDNLEQDYFKLQGLGSAMAGHFVVDGRGGDSDVIEVNNTTFTVAGLNKNLSLKADFIGLGRVNAVSPSDNPGVIVCSGNVTLEADGDSTVATPLWGASGIWGTSVPTHFNGLQAPYIARGTVQIMGDIRKTAGNDATLTVKAKHSALVLNTTVSTGASPAGSIVSTTNKLNVILNSDSNASGAGNVMLQHRSVVTTNGGNLTIGGGATPATVPAMGIPGATPTAPGVSIVSSTITTAGGAVSIRGQGAINTNGMGVLMNVFAGSVNNSLSTGAGNVGIVGTGGANATNTLGFALLGNASSSPPLSSSISTTTGNVSITATAGGGNNEGIRLSTLSSIASSGSGAINLNGTGAGLGVGIMMNPVASETASVSSTSGNITLRANKMNLNGGAGTESIATGSSNEVNLRVNTGGQAVDLGSAVDTTASMLELGTAELNNITAGTLRITASTGINVSGVIAPLNFKTLSFNPTTGTTFAATGGFTADVTSASDFEKMIAGGTVSITAGATLSLASAGGYVWNGTDTFTFLDNDAADPISGTFTGPTLTNFLGSALTATQSYTGGTGNDLVFSAPLSSNADLSSLVINTATYSPAFAAGTTTGYTASVSNATSSVTLTPTRAQANATIEARSNANAFASVTSGSPSGALALNLGSNTLDVKVTAQDGITIKTYTITVTRRSIIEDWRLGFFADASGTSTRANGADFDSDGKTNLLEFAFGTDPTLGSSGPPALTMTGTYAAAVFGTTGQPITKLESITNGVDYRAVFIRRVDHAAAGLTYTPEFSADNFTSFTPSATLPTVLVTSGDFQLVSVPYPHFLPNGKKARFFRVSVSIAP